MSKNLYSMKAVDKLVDELVNKYHYDFVRLADGSLLDGSFMLVSPIEIYYNYIIREVYLNEWSSAYTVRRAARISKALWDEAEKYEREQEERA